MNESFPQPQENQPKSKKEVNKQKLKAEIAKMKATLTSRGVLPNEPEINQPPAALEDSSSNLLTKEQYEARKRLHEAAKRVDQMQHKPTYKDPDPDSPDSLDHHLDKNERPKGWK